MGRCNIELKNGMSSKVGDWQYQISRQINLDRKVAEIKLNERFSYGFSGVKITNGFEFVDEHDVSILKVGKFNGTQTVFKIKENEQIIGIKARTHKDKLNKYHGVLYNLQFKILSLN